MARPWRIEYENALYHIFSSGNEKREIFQTAEDRVTFMLLLGRMAERFKIDLFAYALAPNQYDLLLRTQTPNLSRAMHWLGTAYTRRFNLKHSRSGHLFQGRYRSILVENAECLAEVSGFMHLKPVRLLLAQDPADYPWSSYNAYAFGTPLPIRIDTRFILSSLKDPDPHRAYRELAIRTGANGKMILRKLHHGILYGSREFVERIRSNYLETGPNPDVSGQRRVFCDRSLNQLSAEASAALSPVGNAMLTDRDRTECDLRMFYLWQTGMFKNRDIGSLFDLSQSAVSRRVKLFAERIKEDPEMAARLSALSRKMKVWSIRRDVIDCAA